MLFQELGLDEKVLAALTRNGYTEATKIQEEVIKAAMAGKSIIGQSQTGTGKTAAFVIPLLQKLDANIRKPQVIVLAPTRELAMQIREEFFKLSYGTNLRSIAVYGGSNIRAQREALEGGPQVVVATTGRLIDLIERRFIDLSNVEYLVLDEVDRMLDMGFIDDIDMIWSRLGNVKQSMTFSATIPQEVNNLLAKYVGDGYESIKATENLMVSKIDHAFIEVPHFEKYDMLKKYVQDHKDVKIVVFCRMKHETEDIADMLERDGFSTGCLHGDMQQRDRTRSLKRFQDGFCNVFITTDVAARGLNMKDIMLVVNYNVPEDPEAYIHRIGRTGRAGAEGKAIMFVTSGERNLLGNIERRNKITLKQIDIHGNEVVRLAGRGGGNGGHHSGGNRRSFGGRSGGGYQGRSSGGYQGNRSSGGFGGGERSSSGGYARRDEGASERPRSSSGYQGNRSTGGFGGGERSSGGYQGNRSEGRPSYGTDRPRSSGGYQGGDGSSGGYQGGERSSGGYQGNRPERLRSGADTFGGVFGGGAAPRTSDRPSYGSDRPQSDRPKFDGERKDRAGYEKRSYEAPRNRDNAGGERKTWPAREKKDM
ncbi:MAG: DEAD/DEAH box helicase [Candidatus Gracilibacteria bacterium]|nr:DEAD/DEAH box helicase [Candidatus Gracilibacteria bacterium]